MRIGVDFTTQVALPAHSGASDLYPAVPLADAFAIDLPAASTRLRYSAAS